MLSVVAYRKDSNGFFAFPVTDNIAPGYSSIISHPMDFSTMKTKIEDSLYSSVAEFRVRTHSSTLLMIFIFIIEIVAWIIVN